MRRSRLPHGRFMRLPSRSSRLRLCVIPDPKGMRAKEVDVAKGGVTILYSVRGARRA